MSIACRSDLRSYRPTPAGVIQFLVIILACAFRVPPAAAQADTAEAPEGRLLWGSVNVLLLPDSSAGIRLWVQATSHAYDNDPPQLFIGAFDPDSFDTWLSQAQSVVHPADSIPASEMKDLKTPHLTALDGAFLYLDRRNRAPGLEPVVTFSFYDNEALKFWSLEVSTQQFRDFLTAAARPLSLSRLKPMPGDPYRPNPINGSRCPKPVDRHAFAYFSEFRSQVWVEFVVDAAGHVEEGSLRLLVGNDPALRDELQQRLPSLRFSPCTVNGQPVRTLADLVVGAVP